MRATFLTKEIIGNLSEAFFQISKQYRQVIPTSSDIIGLDKNMHLNNINFGQIGFLLPNTS